MLNETYTILFAVPPGGETPAVEAQADKQYQFVTFDFIYIILDSSGLYLAYASRSDLTRLIAGIARQYFYGSEYNPP
jgi:hypothetical protein